MRFVDTNVLLYAVSTAQDEALKATEARGILDGTDLALSVQVLQEFYVQATHSSRPGRLSHDQAAGLIEAWLRFPVQETTVALMRAGAQAAVRYRMSYWDAAIIEAARSLGCEAVLSEDLSHGEDYGGVKVTNPFRRRRYDKGRRP
ncbi:MAG: PIN domain-containing protein [Acidobacteria bacterium]|nr:PIN domain-containing protein [Acidobacteriota bacterium]